MPTGLAWTVLMLSGSMGRCSTEISNLWTEELLLCGQQFKLLHGLLNPAQFKPLIGQRLWELSEVGTREMGECPSTPTSASGYCDGFLW